MPDKHSGTSKNTNIRRVCHYAPPSAPKGIKNINILNPLLYFPLPLAGEGSIFCPPRSVGFSLLFWLHCLVARCGGWRLNSYRKIFDLRQ